MSQWPRRVDVIDVTPRDGLQDARGTLDTPQKIRLVRELFAAGIRQVEITSFVSPRWVPKLADAETVASAFASQPGTIALIPNLKGFERAVAAGVEAVTFVVSASSRHQQDNLRMPIERSFEELERIRDALAGHPKVRLRGAISCSFGSPYAEENIRAEDVAQIARRLAAAGADEIGLADTVGMGTPKQVAEVIDAVRTVLPDVPLVLHLHDRCGLALANITVALERGVTRFETALGGLGGCPFAPNAPGNLDTETFVEWMDAMGVETGVDRQALARTRAWLLDALVISA
jgi:hydroxymethylglutaryl-CoA lyase